MWTGNERTFFGTVGLSHLVIFGLLRANSNQFLLFHRLDWTGLKFGFNLLKVVVFTRVFECTEKVRMVSN